MVSNSSLVQVPGSGTSHAVLAGVEFVSALS